MRNLFISIFLIIFAMPAMALSKINISPELKQQYPEGIKKCICFEYVLAAQKNGKWGLVDYNGNCIIPFEYDYILDCGHYSTTDDPFISICEIIAKKKGKLGVIDLNNHILMPFKQKKYCISAKQHMALATKANEKYGASSYRAKIKQLKDAYDSYIKRRKVTPVCSDGKWGFVSQAEPTPTYEYDSCEKLGENVFLVSKNGKYGTVDIDDAEIILPIEYTIWQMPDYYLLFNKDDKQGILDIETGEVVLRCVYDTIFPAENISPRLFYIIKDEKWGLGNFKGELCSCKYDFIDRFNTNNEAVYYCKGHTGRINTQGKETVSAVKAIFDRAYNTKDNQPELKIQLYQEAIELDKILKSDYTSLCLNNIGVIYENAGDRKTALSYYSQASALGNQKAAQNYKTLRGQIRAEKWQAISEALQNMSSSLAATANQYNSYNNAGYSNSTYNSSSGSSSTSANSKTGHSMSEVQLKNTDSRTYSHDESLLIKMNTYWETQYNDNERRNIQQRMKRIRAKWENRGFQFYHSTWEDWDGRKR